MTMRLLLGLLVIAGIGLAGSPAMAQGYIGSGGASLMDDQGVQLAYGGAEDPFDRAGVGAFGSIGYKWDKAFATEIEGGLMARSVDGAEEGSSSRGADEQTALLMFNARIAPSVSGPLKPYAGLGAGFAYVNTQDYGLRQEHDSMAPAGQAMAGFSLEMSERTSLFAEYRYLKMLDGGSGGSNARESDQSHAGFFGLRIQLGDLE